MKILSLLSLALAPTLCAAKTPPSPNIVFLLMDDLGLGDLGINGQKYIETPHIDALAKQGKMLTQHYAGAPVSAPSRGVTMTGMHTGHAEVRGNDEMGERGEVYNFKLMFEHPTMEGQRPMKECSNTLVRSLKEAGYTTGCIGKWGLGAPFSSSAPNAFGFDFFYGYNCQRLAHHYYPTHLWRNEERELFFPGNPIMPASERLAPNADKYDLRSYDKFKHAVYAPFKLQQETLSFIDKNKNTPFFLWWTTPMPHVSLQAPEELIAYYTEKFKALGINEEPFLGDSYLPARYPRATYAAMVTYIDQCVGEIIERLKANDIYDNTIIVFTSDNGPSTAGGVNAPWFDSARPHKSEWGWGKASLHEGGIHVPTFVVWENKIAANTQSDLLCAGMDWYPTLMEIAGKEAPETDGISFAPTLLNEHATQPKHEYLYWEFPEMEGSIAVREGKWKLIISGVRTTPIYKLFDLSNDKREETNLYTQYPEVAGRLIGHARQAHTESKNPRFNMGLPALLKQQ